MLAYSILATAVLRGARPAANRTSGLPGAWRPCRGSSSRGPSAGGAGRPPEPATMAKANKCLARSNKTRTAGKATKEADPANETMTNATMTASLTPAVMPARHLGPVAIFQWPLAWAMICLLLAVDFVWASQVGLTIGGGEIKAGLIGALLALSAACRRRNRGIANMAEAIALWFAFTATVAVLSYLAASCAFPLQDVMMERLDRAIGFDWSAWHDAVLDRPILSCLLLVAYNSLLPQVLLSIIYFSATDRSARIGELLLLAGATLAATVLISAIWPTLGPFAAHGQLGVRRTALATAICEICWHYVRAGLGISSCRRCKAS